MSFTVVSWNLALMQASAQSPAGWSMNNTEAAVRRRILEIDPDVVTLQELPGVVPWVETLDMVRANPATHSGNLATLARHDHLDPAPLLAKSPGALITHLPALTLTVVNVHLAPGSAAAEERLTQIEAALAVTNRRRVLIVGDTNTRADEMAAVAELGLLTPRPPKPTWDSRRNGFTRDGPAFTAYFTRLAHTPDLSVEEMTVPVTPEHHDGHRFHLSDHHPLVARFG